MCRRAASARIEMRPSSRSTATMARSTSSSAGGWTPERASSPGLDVMTSTYVREHRSSNLVANPGPIVSSLGLRPAAGIQPGTADLSYGVDSHCDARRGGLAVAHDQDGLPGGLHALQGNPHH